MPALHLPGPAVHRSFLAAMGEFRAEGRGGPRDDSMLGMELAAWGGRWGTAEGFAAYVAELRAQAEEATPRPPGWVPCTTWWWVEGPEFIGRIALRHRLTGALRAAGGHIGYDVRPSARRRGHATAMLAAVLPLARAAGIEAALVTCDVANVGSRRVIEANGGALDGEVAGRLRYWVPTG